MTATVILLRDTLNWKARHEAQAPEIRLLRLNRLIADAESRATAQADTIKAKLAADIDVPVLEQALWATMDTLVLLREEQWALVKAAS